MKEKNCIVKIRKVSNGYIVGIKRQVEKEDGGLVTVPEVLVFEDIVDLLDEARKVLNGWVV